MVGQGDTPDSSLKTNADTIEKLKTADSTTQLLKEIEKLRAERTEAFKGSVFSRVLEIDSSNGELFFRNPDKSILKNKDDVTSSSIRISWLPKGRNFSTWYFTQGISIVVIPPEGNAKITSAGLMASFGLSISQASFPKGERNVYPCAG